MTNLTLKNGFKFKVNEEIVSDYEVQEAYFKLYDPESSEADQGIALIKLVDKIFGKDKKRLLDCLRNKKTGIIPADKPGECVGEVIQKLGELNAAKKS